MNGRCLAAAISLLVACDGGANDEFADASASDAPASTAWLPAPPSADEFAWQGSQNRLLQVSGGPGCTRAEVVLAMWERAVCYTAADGQLMCAGQIGETVFGPDFVPAGIEGAVQLLGSPTFNTDAGSAACARKSDGTAWCLGYSAGNAALFRTDDGLAPGAQWKRWGDRSDITELATGTMDTICARYGDGTADCVGYTCGLEGSPQPCQTYDAADPFSVGSQVRSLWIDTFGRVHIDDPAAFRTGNSRTSCLVVPDGLACTEPPDVITALELGGAPNTAHGIVVSTAGDGGAIVDGNAASIGSVCWLTASGQIRCLEVEEPPADPDTAPRAVEYFSGHRALALAVNGYSRDFDRCVVVDDGSLWCIGGNFHGKFGTGSTAPLTTETQVQPPGSVRINCTGGP